MKDFIKVEMFFDGEQYRARCPQLGVCAEGVTLDELIRNLEETVGLHVERSLHCPLYCVYRFLKR
jgi:predicted RNase H-like HicB family nuclease